MLSLLLTGFWCAFFIGGVMVMVGMIGSGLADCPKLMVQFPAPVWHCNLFTGLVFGGGVALVVGITAAVMMMYWADTYPDSKIGRNLWATKKAD